jgi:epoxyqueuosine reductase QueG
MSKVTAYNSLKKYCQSLGIELFGVGDISGVKEHIKVSKNVLEKLDKAVCLGVRLSGSILEEITSAPTRLYFHHYRTVNAFLDQSALKVSNYIQSKGFRALSIPASIIVDWENQTAHLSHRHLGVLAGLGWIGRNNLLVSKKLGSQFRLATILTDMPLKLDKPSKDNCNTCRLCVSACPAKAIKEDPAGFDRIKCLEKLKDFQKQKLVDQYICGVCVNVCKGHRK